MTLRTKIAVVAATLFLAGCQELPGYFASDTTLARAGGSELKMRDVESVVPKGVTGEDSAAFMKVYVDRWVRKQLKLQEAEILFSASADDIDKMVEEYRQALLIRKLDQHYVDRSIDTTFTENEIAAYYNAHKADFRLDRTLVKGRIVQFGEGYRQARKLRELMGTKSEARQQDFRDICAKNDFTVTDFSDQWVDFPEFLSYLPTLRSQNYDPVLASTAVQEMRGGRSAPPAIRTTISRSTPCAAKGSPSRSNGCGGRSAASSSTSARARSSAATRRNSITVRAKAGA